jgi:hypothetical protein
MSEPEGYTDWRPDAIVALENAARELRAVKEKLAEEVRRDEQCFDAIMAEVREHEDFKVFRRLGVQALRSFAATRRSPGIATDGDEPPSRAL